MFGLPGCCIPPCHWRTLGGNASVELQQLVVSLLLLLMMILLFGFIIYDSTLGVLGVWYCWLDKTSNFNMSPQTLGICDEHFP